MLLYINNNTKITNEQKLNKKKIIHLIIKNLFKRWLDCVIQLAKTFEKSNS